MFWTKRKVFGVLKQHIHIYKPGVYQDLIKWTTYPITTLLKALAIKLTQMMQESHLMTYEAFYLIEVIAGLERVLAYAYTGSARVLMKGLMNPLWLTRGLVLHGFPSINKKIIQLSIHPENGQVSVTVNPRYWPVDEHGMVVRASTRTAELTYGKPFALVCFGDDWMLF